MRFYLLLPLLLLLSACNSGKGSKIEDGFLGGVSISTSKSTLSVSSATIVLGESFTVTLTLRDQSGNLFYVPNSHPTVVFTNSGGTSAGTFSSVTDHQNGVFTATFTGTSAGSATTIKATVDGAEKTAQNPTVTVLAGNLSPANSYVSVSSANVTSGSSVTLTLHTIDTSGTPLTSGGYTVVFSAAGGTSTGNISATIDNGDGTYTATFQGITAGSATSINATISAQAVTHAAPTVTVTHGAATQIVFTMQPAGGVAEGVNLPTQPVLEIRDANGNLVTSGADATADVTLSLSSGTGALGGTLTQTSVGGVATFSGISVDTQGSGKVITATKANTLFSGGTTSKTVASNSLTINPPTPGAFAISSAVAGASQVVLTWGASTNASSYTVKYGTSSGSYGSTFSASATSPTTVTGLTPGTTYYFMVMAVNTSGSVNANAEVSATAMGAFSMTSVTAGVGQATIVWPSTNGATSYDILYGTATNTYSTTLTGQTSPTTITGLSAGTTYYFRIRANNANGHVFSTNELSIAVLQNFTLNIPFTAGTNASYDISSSSVELTGGVARLKPADQTDDDGTASKFGAATMSGVQWDSSNNFVRLNTTTNNAELDASWAPQWSGLVGYWKLNEAAGSASAADSSSGGAGTGSLAGTYTRGVDGQLKLATMFDGSTGYISVPTSNAIKAAFPFTLSAWVKPAANGSSAGAGIISTDQYDNGVYYGASMRLSNTNTVYLTYGNGGAAGPASHYTGVSSVTIQNGVWTHLVGVFSTANSFVLYINGQAASLTYSGTASSIDYSTGPSFIGSTTSASNAGNGAGRYFNGTIDEASIWNVGLNSTQVQTIYQRQSAKYSGLLQSRVMDAWTSAQPWTTLSPITTLPFYKELPGSSGSESSTDYSSVGGSLTNSLVGLWHLNESAGTSGAGSVLDKSAVASPNNGTPNGGVTFGATGVLGGSAAFDGTSGYITISDSSTIKDYTTGDSVSLSAWARRTGPSTGWRALLTKNSTSSAAARNYELVFAGTTLGAPNNSIAFYFRNAANSAWHGYASTATITDTSWHHYTFTYTYGDASSARMYMDGKLLAGSWVDGNGSAAPASTGNGPLYLARTSSSTEYLNGSLDEVAVWNRTLSAGEILELYRRGANRLKYQLRTCSASDCSDQDALSSKGWKGPDNSNQSYFSELYNTTSNVLAGTVLTTSPTMTFSNFSGTGLSISNNRYFQYRAILESDDANTLCNYGGGANTDACSPELKSVGAGPTHYDTTIQSIISKASIGSSYQTIDANGFTETGGSCSSGLKYALSSDGSTFYYWNGSTWTTSSDYTTASDAATVRTNISSFPSSPAGIGILQIKTFLKSTGTSSCQVDDLQVTGKKY
ncbi:MAG: fibronectin type III domain-containing protein [Bdellovibrionaceae bacterium]|nr:fibronectin type III domain-containing protein [Pseudobdellovibrionaceae bacterium]